MSGACGIHKAEAYIYTVMLQFTHNNERNNSDAMFVFISKKMRCNIKQHLGAMLSYSPAFAIWLSIKTSSSTHTLFFSYILSQLSCASLYSIVDTPRNLHIYNIYIYICLSSAISIQMMKWRVVSLNTHMMRGNNVDFDGGGIKGSRGTPISLPGFC